MRIKREIIESIIDLLNTALNAECDAFGISHNEAIDILNILELLIETEK